MKEQLTCLLNAAEYLKDSDSIAQMKRLQQTLEDQHYLLTVVGQFSAGKSKLINNLLGREVLPVHITETTAIVTFIKYGEEEQASILYRDGSFDTISIEDSLRLWQSGESKETLSEIISIHITLCSELLKNGLVIADTPGVNTIIERHIEETESILTSADRILYVLKKPLTDSDATFIRTIEAQGIPVILVRTHMDDLKQNEEKADETIAKEQEQFAELSNERVFFLSNEKDSGFYENLKDLRSYLTTEIADRVTEAVQSAVHDRMLFIAGRLQRMLQDRSIRLNTLLSSGETAYQEERKETEDALKSLEAVLQEKRQKLTDRYEKTKKEAEENLQEDKNAELRKVKNQILAMDTSNKDACHSKVLSILRTSFERMHSNYCDTFDKLIAENSKQFLEEMRQNPQMMDAVLELPDSLETADEQASALTDKMQALLTLKEQLSGEIVELEHRQSDNEENYVSAEQELTEMREALAAVQEQLDDFPPYVARYITVKGNHTNEKIWRGIGNVLDWATIFIPGPTWAKAGAKVFQVGAKGAKALKAVKAADAFIDGARILGKVAKGVDAAKAVKGAKVLKHAPDALRVVEVAGNAKKMSMLNRNPDVYQALGQIAGNEEQPDFSPIVQEENKASLLDYIGLDYWFAKIGKKFDTPDTKAVDAEYENEYYKQKNAIQNELRRQAKKKKKKNVKHRAISDELERIRFEKDITAKKMKIAEEQIAEMKKELEEEKKKAYQNTIRQYYVGEAQKHIEQYAQYIRDEVQPEIEQKMQDYINLYDFRISGDISRKRTELEQIEAAFRSADRQQTEQDLAQCRKFADTVNGMLKAE